MRNFIFTAIAAMVILLGTSATAATGDDVASLRGAYELEKDSKMFAKKKVLKATGGFERSFELQPPLIPHAIDKDRITLKNNSCMKCHSAKNYEMEKAPKVGDSHFKDRDDNVLKTLSSRRYFCSQCHIPQVEASPLVENTF